MCATIFLIICIILLVAIIGVGVYHQNENKPTEEESITDHIIDAKAKVYACGVPVDTPLVIVGNPYEVYEKLILNGRTEKKKDGLYIFDMKIYARDDVQKGQFYIIQAENFDENEKGTHRYY